MPRLTAIRFTSLVLIGAAAAVGLWFGTHTTHGSSLRPIDDFQSPAMGISFTQVGSANATSHVLPDGSPALSLSRALDVAGGYSMASVDPRTIAGVSYVARYGVFNDAQLHDVHTRQTAFVDRTVWLVRYYGPGVDIPMGCASGSTQCPMAHEVTVVIDAATGQHLDSYIG